MDPIPGKLPSEALGLPRTRGDGPAGHILDRAAGRASPHTRGWTRPGVGQHVLSIGFPAHAGMDPLETSSSYGSGRLPRTRGDGPPSAPPVIVMS